jgi:hypothetical protein
MSVSEPGLEPEDNVPKNEPKEGKKAAKRKEPPKITLVPAEALPPRALAVRTPEGALAIPTSAQMSELLATVKDPMRMTELHQMAIEWEASAERLKKAKAEIFAVAEFRLRLARQIGIHLLEHVHRGGHGSNAGNKRSMRGGSSSRLPDGITRNQSRWYRKLAAIRDDQVETYLETRRAKGKPPSEGGLLKFAGVERSRSNRPSVTRGRPRFQRLDEAIWLPVWEAVWPIMKVDLAVGVDPELVKATQGLDVADLRPKHLKGNVLVKASEDVEEWLNRLYDAKQAGQVRWALMAFSATTGEPWFRLLDQRGWTCCFLRSATERAAIVAYLCDQPHRLAARLNRVGAVLCGCKAQEQRL